MRPMRRAFQQVDDLATLERWLNEVMVGRLATVDEDGCPIIKPVNYVYAGGCVYSHSARAPVHCRLGVSEREGQKLDDVRRDGKNDRQG